MSRTVVAVFDSHDGAVQAARRIKEKGLKTDDISIVTKDNQTGSDDVSDRGTTATMGTADRDRGVNDNISDGVVTGSVLGGLAGLVIGAGSLMIPGFGIIAAAGPITGLLSGAVTGGIVGGLVDLGIPEDKSREYETSIKGGKTIFTMKSDDDKINSVTSILKSSGANSVEAY
jgi:hypothetical protein